MLPVLYRKFVPGGLARGRAAENAAASRLRVAAAMSVSSSQVNPLDIRSRWSAVIPALGSPGGHSGARTGVCTANFPSRTSSPVAAEVMLLATEYDGISASASSAGLGLYRW